MVEHIAAETHATPTDAEDFFEHWLRLRGQDPRDPLSAKAAKPYRYVWRMWCRWLTTPSATSPARAATWMEATPSDVAAFLEMGPSPSSSRKSRTDPISDITRRRYWRVLDALYAHARNRGQVQTNPAEQLQTGRPPAEKPEGQVFNALQWAMLREALPSGTSKWDVRDRAMLQLLMDAALTTGEICALRRRQVGDDFLHPSLLELRLDGPRKAQQRAIQLGREASIDLRRWLELRRGTAGPSAGGDELVFVSQKGRHMSPRALFHLVAGTVMRAFTANGIDVPSHIGAQVLRNTRLVMWLNAGMPVAEVVHRAGFKDAKSFRGLRAHVDERVLPALKPPREGRLNPYLPRNWAEEVMGSSRPKEVKPG